MFCNEYCTIQNISTISSSSDNYQHGHWSNLIKTVHFHQIIVIQQHNHNAVQLQPEFEWNIPLAVTDAYLNLNGTFRFLDGILPDLLSLYTADRWDFSSGCTDTTTWTDLTSEVASPELVVVMTWSPWTDHIARGTSLVWSPLSAGPKFKTYISTASHTNVIKYSFTT